MTSIGALPGRRRSAVVIRPLGSFKSSEAKGAIRGENMSEVPLRVVRLMFCKICEDSYPSRGGKV